MSRNREVRNKKKAEKSAQEAEWTSRPPLPQKRGTNHLSLLQYDPKNWFPDDQIEASERFRLALKSEEKNQLARELIDEGYTNFEESKHLSREHIVVLSFWSDLLDSLWPPELEEALFKEDERSEQDADALIRFLEISPFFFRSGYSKQKAIRRLALCPLSGEHRRRISGLLRKQLKHIPRRQMPGWLNLVRLSDPEETA